MGIEVQAELDRINGNVSAAFAAINDKGGTVPSSKVSGNLASAINSIPLGVTVRSVSGTFETDSDGGATVNCGFKPDLVAMFVTEANEYGNYYHPVFGFAALDNETLVQCSEALEYLLYISATRTTTGFTIDWADKWSFDWDAIGVASRQKFQYVAVKYTA